MKPEDKIRDSVTIRQLLAYHGVSHLTCPLNSGHQLALPSDKLAVCLDCGMEWDAVSLHEVLESTTHQAAVDELWGFVAKYPLEADWITWQYDNEFGAGQAWERALVAFDEWLRSITPNIAETCTYDGHPETAKAFVNLKGNLVLLPSAFIEVSVGTLGRWEQEWEQRRLLRISNTESLKRTQRIPAPIQRAQGLPLTMRLYTFHRWETAQLLGIQLPASQSA